MSGLHAIREAVKPFFIVDTVNPFDQACSDRKDAVPSHGFRLLAIRDSVDTPRSKSLVCHGLMDGAQGVETTMADVIQQAAASGSASACSMG